MKSKWTRQAKRLAALTLAVLLSLGMVTPFRSDVYAASMGNAAQETEESAQTDDAALNEEESVGTLEETSEAESDDIQVNEPGELEAEVESTSEEDLTEDSIMRKLC